MRELGKYLRSREMGRRFVRVDRQACHEIGDWVFDSLAQIQNLLLDTDRDCMGSSSLDFKSGPSTSSDPAR